MPSETSKEALRKIIASALADLISYIGSTKAPIVIGGQYSNERLITVFKDWMAERQFSITGAPETAKNWITMCNEGMFVGSGVIEAPAPPPAPPTTPHVDEVEPDEVEPDEVEPDEVEPDEVEPDEVEPDDGYFSADEWKPKKERKRNWQEEGEDWKKEGFEDDDFQPT